MVKLCRATEEKFLLAGMQGLVTLKRVSTNVFFCKLQLFLNVEAHASENGSEMYKDGTARNKTHATTNNSERISRC